MTQQHKALIVDDQQGVLDILGAILSSLDHAYDYARTQREARDLLRANRYCYILLDLEFPADEGITARIQTGFNCLAEIRQRFHRDELPVIIMTAHENGTEYPIRALQLGANDFAQKDFDEDLEPLDVKIRRVLAHACDVAGDCQRKPSRQAGGSGESHPLGHTFYFHGESRRRRYRMEINGSPCWVCLSTFTMLWKLASASSQGSGGWVDGRDLNSGNYHNAIARMKKDLEQAAGLDGRLVENDGQGRFRATGSSDSFSYDTEAIHVHHPRLLERYPLGPGLGRNKAPTGGLRPAGARA